MVLQLWLNAVKAVSLVHLQILKYAYKELKDFTLMKEFLKNVQEDVKTVIPQLQQNV